MNFAKVILIKMPTINLPRQKKRDITVSKRSYQKIYQDSAWFRLRRRKLKNNPLCEICETNGKVVQTQEVHHIIPFDYGIDEEDKKRLAFDYDNLMSLCIECHKSEHKKLIK